MAKAHTLVDSFNDNSQDTAKWLASTSERLREANGRVEIHPPGNTASSSYSYQSASPYDLTASEIRIELVRAPSRATGTVAFLQARIDDGNRIDFVVSSGNLTCDVYAASVFTRLLRIPHDPALHRWLRLRERFGIVYWEVSANGAEWTVLATRSPHPINLSAVYLAFGAGTFAPVPAPGVTVFDNFNVQDSSRARRLDERRLSARDVRVEAAELAAARNHEEHANNNDEVNYPTRLLAGSYSKSLKHDALGDPDPGSYSTLLRALESRDPQDFEEIILASPTALKLTNPQAGLAFDLAGPDAQEWTLPPAPRFDSLVVAHEMGELYWMALLRDVPFVNWPEQVEESALQRALASLNGEFGQFGGTTPVTAQNLFRGIFPGEQVGPYVSQFLWKGNADPHKPEGQGRDAWDGFITYGSQVIDQRQWTAAQNVNYLRDFADWLAVQNGRDDRGAYQLDTGQRRFIRSLRDGTRYVHHAQGVNAFLNAAFLLLSEPTGGQNAGTGAGRPLVDMEFPFNRGNPYARNGSATQVGGATFGPAHLLQVLAEAAGRATRAVWWQKWGVHRRLRPEEFGGRVHNHLTGARTYPIHADLLTRMQSGGLSTYYRSDTGYLLPQAYPEGAPTHPAYGAEHAAIGGACATVLKAFFDESTPIENPVQANFDGLVLEPYTGADAGQMTVGGELNKLAGNIALFRNAAGVHWRSDYTESLPFGEAIAIGLLQEMSLGFNEDDAFFELTKFDGQKIRIFDGKVMPTIA